MKSMMLSSIATGARKPRKIPVPGHERAVAALDFLRESKLDRAKVGKNVVIIGAGNVGCDAAAEAARLGAESITLIDIQKPASSGVERKHAEAAGAKFLWPRFTKAITETAVELTNGEILPADTVIMSVGDQPDLSFLPEEIKTERGFIAVDERFQSSDPKVYAIGDAVRLGLLTEAIGSGRVAAREIDNLLRGREDTYDQLPAIDTERVQLEYYDPRLPAFTMPRPAPPAAPPAAPAATAASARPSARRMRSPGGRWKAKEYEYVVDADRCIGCGFCAGACPCGIWRLTENDPTGIAGLWHNDCCTVRCFSKRSGGNETKMYFYRIQEALMKRVSAEMHHCKPERQCLFRINGGSHGANRGFWIERF